MTIITIPAALAGGAHKAGEESELLVYLLARSLDRQGSGRIRECALVDAAGEMMSRRHAQRVLHGAHGARYWTPEGEWLSLAGTGRLAGTFEGEIVGNAWAVRFEIADLNTRPRRSAALLAAMLAGETRPRSYAYISRFAGVDRKTIARWQKDLVISERILTKEATWATI